MIDDPLGLVVQAIAVLAAGMYPVGFLFGVCSDCCCPACNLCSSAYISCYPTEFTVTFNGQSHTYYADDFVHTDDGFAEMPPNTFQFSYPSAPPAYQTPYPFTLVDALECESFTVIENVNVPARANVIFGITGYGYGRQLTNECGCQECQFSFGYIFRYRIEVAEYFEVIQDGQVVDVYNEGELLGGGLLGPFGLTTADPATSGGEDIDLPNKFFHRIGNYCDESPITLAFRGETVFSSPNFWPGETVYPEECHPAEFDDATVDMEMTFDTAECDCGACCTDGTCTSNVPETHCESEEGLAGDWQGTGTTCDPNPCE